MNISTSSPACTPKTTRSCLGTRAEARSVNRLAITKQDNQDPVSRPTLCGALTLNRDLVKHSVTGSAPCGTLCLRLPTSVVTVTFATSCAERIHKNQIVPHTGRAAPGDRNDCLKRSSGRFGTPSLFLFEAPYLGSHLDISTGFATPRQYRWRWRGEAGSACDCFPQPRFCPARLGGVFLWSGAAAVAACGGVVLGIRLRFHHHTPEQAPSAWRFTNLQPISSGATTSAGRRKKAWGRGGKSWEGVVAMGVAASLPSAC